MEALYIHIPFCKTICSYCDFCKVFYQEKWTKPYIEELKKELDEYGLSRPLSTIYIGGGTPNSLSNKELEILFNWIDTLPKQENIEYTIECNVELITKEQISLFLKHGINRVSIGIQTTHDHHLAKLNRHHNQDEIEYKINLISRMGIKNINVDLMYAFPNETMEELEKDINFFLTLPITHISTYSLMIEPNTKLYIENIQPISEDLDAEMYNLICHKLKENNFEHYEISNFAKIGYQSKHNLTYWRNKGYYGIGVGASGYIENLRYTNTRSLTAYLNGTRHLEEESISKELNQEYELMLKLRLKEGLSISEYQNKYGIDLLSLDSVKREMRKQNIEYHDDRMFIPEHKLYISNEILVDLL